MKNSPEHKSLYLAIITAFSLTAYSTPTGNSNVLRLGEIDGQNGFKIRGITDSRIGASVYGIGDINGDGIDDLLVGSSPINNAIQTKSYVIFGSNGNMPHPFELSSLDGSNGFVINEWVKVQKAGDFNGDGRDDVMFNNILLYGKNTPFSATMDLKNITPNEGMVIIGGQNYSGVGDINGDGFDDLSVGTPFEDGVIVSCEFEEKGYYYSEEREFFRGANYIIFGNNEENGNISLDDINPEDGFKILGRSNQNVLATGAVFGISSNGIGDINGDGFDDFTVGAKGEKIIVYDERCISSPRSYVIFGSAQQPYTAVESVDDLNGSNGFWFNNDTNFPFTAMGDLNNDGADDFSVCGSSCAFIFGRKEEMFPAAVRIEPNYDGTDGFITNIPPSDYFIPVNNFLDFNNDGYLDVIMTSGTPVDFASRNAYILYGHDNSFFSFYDKDNLPINQGLIIQAANNSIRTMDSAGDVNNDGIPDVIIGLPFSFFDKGQSFVIYGHSDIIFKTSFEIDF